MSRVARWCLGGLAAWGTAFVGTAIVRAIGLIVPEAMAWAAALAVGAVLAALVAGWANTLLAGDGTRTRLLPVAALAGGAAVLLAVPVGDGTVVTAVARGLPIPNAPIAIAALSSAALAIVAGAGAGALRRRGGVERDRRATAILLSGALLIAPATVVLAALAGLAGA